MTVGDSLFDTQSIPNAANGLKPDGIGRIALDLASEAVDLHVDRALPDFRFTGDEFMARNGFARTACKYCEDFLLAVGKFQGFSALLEFAPGDLEGIGAENKLLDLR